MGRMTLLGVGSSIVYDPDALTLITAAPITDIVQKNAINNIFIEFKDFGLYSKLYAFWLFVGGTAGTNKYNAKDPRDLDAAYRLSFVNGSGSWTHSATGSKPGGAAGNYANTFLNEQTVMSLNNKGISIYLRTDSQSTFDIGNFNGASNGTHIAPRQSDLFYSRCSDFNNSPFSNFNSIGFFTASRTASNVIKGYKNGIKVNDLTTASIANLNLNYFLGALNSNGTSAFNSPKEIKGGFDLLDLSRLCCLFIEGEGK